MRAMRARSTSDAMSSNRNEHTGAGGASTETGGSEQRHEVVAITGASAGIGRAVVQAFARRGAYIGLMARGQAGLDGAQREVEALGGKAIAISTDTADADAVEAAAERIEAEFGPIDIWVNVAFTNVFAEFKDLTAAEYRRVTEVSYLGFVHGTMSALHRMLPRDHGTIIQVGSALGYRSIPLQAAYCGAKHAINGFTDSIRTELIHNKSKVKIAIAQMPAVNTPQFTWVKNKLAHHAQPVPPIYNPAVAGEAVYWLAHHPKREMYVGGSTAIVITGNKFFPAFGDWYLGKTGYKSQQTSQPHNPQQPVNLYDPMDAEKDYGARGVFDSREHNRSYEVWVSEHLGLVLAAGAGVAAAGIAIAGVATGLLSSKTR